MHFYTLHPYYMQSVVNLCAAVKEEDFFFLHIVLCIKIILFCSLRIWIEIEKHVTHLENSNLKCIGLYYNCKIKQKQCENKKL